MTKVLVIDDEPAIVRFLQRALESSGYGVHSATDGAEGLRIAAEQKPDLVVLDLAMPGLSGAAVLAALMAQDPSLRVIVVSAMDDVEGRVRCLDAGAVDFIGKPFAVAELLARVRSRLRSGCARRGRGAERAPRGPDQARPAHPAPLQRKPRGRPLPARVRPHAAPDAPRRLGLHPGGAASDVWGYAFDPGSNVVDVTVARLRGKLRDLHIETIRNVGYVLREA